MPSNVNTTSLEGPCALSADGRRMAFYTNRLLIASTSTILLYDVATAQLRIPDEVRQLWYPQNPSLSGDGRFLAMQYQVSGPFDQYVGMLDVEADTMLALPNLNEPNATNFDPSVNGDGTLIAFASNRFGGRGGWDIFLYSVPEDRIVPLPGLNTEKNELSASISRDGRYIAFQSGVRDQPDTLIDVYVYDRQTASLLPLPGANTPFSDVQPAISPDGRYLAFQTEYEDGGDIRVYDIREKRLLRLQGLNVPYYKDQFPALASPGIGLPKSLGIKPLARR
jgi:Tol biopolymer transport system component